MDDTEQAVSAALVGEGPSIAAVSAAIEDIEVTTQESRVSEIGFADLAVVVGVTGSDGLTQANATAVQAEIPWIAVEIGGIGGYGGSPASVSVFGPNGPCYRCLTTRIEANNGSQSSGPQASIQRSDARFAGAIAGRLAVTQLQGESVIGRVVELPATRRTLQPIPTCPRCATGDRGYQPSLDYRGVSLEETAEQAEQAVDPRLGIITGVGERESFPAPYYLAQLASTESFSDAEVMEHAAGVSPDWDAAYVKAVGESLERYAAGVYRTTSFREAAAAEVPNPISPTAFVRPESAITYDPEDSIQWLPATSLTADRDVSVPAEFTVFPPENEDFAPAITTGLGLGTSTVDAVLSGLSEVIERDATMLGWYSTYEPLGLSVDDDSFDVLRRRAAAEGLSTNVVLVTQDIDVPIVAAAVTRDDWPRFAAGSAAALDGEQAAIDALSEAVQNWMELRALGRDDAPQAGTGVARYADQPRPVIDFFDAETTVTATEVGPESVPTGEPELESLCSRVSAADLSAYATRLTTRDVADLGFEVVRVLVPSAQPLFVDDPFFGDRAKTIPRELGYQPRLDRQYHPFP